MTKVTEHQTLPQRISLSVEEGRIKLGVGRNTMYRLLNSGRLRSIRIGRKILIPPSAIDDFLNGLT